MKLIYKRIVLKISGELISDFNNKKFENCIIYNVIKDIKYLIKNGLQISVVIGGGNLFRGATLSNKSNINRVTADYIGMLATVINGLFLKDLFNKFKITSCLMSSIFVSSLCQTYNIQHALEYLSNSVVVIFCGGLGHPCFTTDSVACLKAIETHSEIIIKGTNVNGIYSKDPNTSKESILYHKLNYQDVLQHEYKVMDLTAFILARDHNIPICIFNIKHKKALNRILNGKNEGTIIHNNIKML